MQTWLFQGNPDDFDMDGYFASRPGQPVWLVTRYASEIAIGDRVYIWRNQGTRGAIAGVAAEAIVTTAPMVRAEDHDALRFWRTEGPRRDAPQMRAGLRLVKVASAREVLQRSWCVDDPILRNLPNLQMAAGTNYRLGRDQALRLDALWSRTGKIGRATKVLQVCGRMQRLTANQCPACPVLLSRASRS